MGLKENVIVGRLIPAGTGAGMNRLRVAASSRDAALRRSSASWPKRSSRRSAPPKSGPPNRRVRRVTRAAPATIRWPRSHPRATARTPMPVSI